MNLKHSMPTLWQLQYSGHISVPVRTRKSIYVWYPAIDISVPVVVSTRDDQLCSLVLVYYSTRVIRIFHWIKSLASGDSRALFAHQIWQHRERSSSLQSWKFLQWFSKHHGFLGRIMCEIIITLGQISGTVCHKRLWNMTYW